MSEVEEKQTPIPILVQPPKMVAVRRRTKKRRSDPPIKRRNLYFLVFSFVTVLIMVAVPGVRQMLSGARSSMGKTHVPPEIWALALAGIALLYLIPGVENTILTVLGIRKPKRNRNTLR